jgi:hypothetical protein
MLSVLPFFYLSEEILTVPVGLSNSPTLDSGSSRNEERLRMSSSYT